MLEMKMSDKFNSIYELVEVDNKDAIVREIKALQNFDEDERASIFGSPNILWILENYSVKELKDKVKHVENKIVINVGDIISFKNFEDTGIMGIILEVTGYSKDRCTALCYNRERGYYKIFEGISAFDITLVDSDYDAEAFKRMLSILGNGERVDQVVDMEGD